MNGPAAAGLTGLAPVAADGSRRFSYVVVEGPVGVGKSALAAALAQRWGARYFPETESVGPGAIPDNPFFSAYQADPARHALATQLSFMLQRDARSAVLAGAAQARDAALVADYLPGKDAIFAQLTLDEREFSLYSRLAAHFATPVPPPDLVIHLQASSETLFARIQNRRDPAEWQVSDSYLRALNDAYDTFFYHYDAAPILSINTDNLNLTGDAGDFELILAQIEAMRGRRASFVKGAL